MIWTIDAVSMLQGVALERIEGMIAIELRWLDNIKKAFFASDQSVWSGHPEDRALEELFKAIDTAKTLDRSLKGETTDSKWNRKRYVEFLYQERIRPENGGLELDLIHARTGKSGRYGFGELVYEIRCMTHENENLNVAENPDYHVLVDWSADHSNAAFWQWEGRAIVSGVFLWSQLRQMLAKFITYIDSVCNLSGTRPFRVTIMPELGSIRPSKGQRAT